MNFEIFDVKALQPASLRRVSVLLALGGCKLRIARAEIPLLEASYFTPLGRRRAVCAVLMEEVADDLGGKIVNAYIERLLSVTVADSDEPLLIVSEQLLDAVREHLAGKPIRAATVTTLISDALPTGAVEYFYRVQLHQRAGDGPFLPLYCDSFGSAGVEPGHQPNALEMLVSFVDTSSAHLCCVTGSFGTGKSTLLLQFALAQLATPTGTAVVPLYVNLAGVGAAGVQRAVENGIRDLFGGQFAVDAKDLNEVLRPDARIVLLLDSLDEQLEINPKAVGHMVDAIIGYPLAGVQTIVAFRPELFQGDDDLTSVFSTYLFECGVEVKQLRLASPLLTEDLESHYDQVLDRLEAMAGSETRKQAAKLARRPLWLRTVRAYADRKSTGVRPGLLPFVECCIEEWHLREAATRRPILRSDHREALTHVLALCLESGIGIAIDEPGRIHRRELINFIRRFIPRWQQVTEGELAYHRWLQYPPDLIAESLAVANLLTIDEYGYLHFADSLFHTYYLASTYHQLLIQPEGGWIADSTILDVFGVNKPSDLFGVAPVRRGLTTTLLSELGKRHSHSEVAVRKSIESMLESLRWPTEVPAVPSLEELVVGYETRPGEANHAYELLVPDHWPRFGSCYSAYSAVALLHECTPGDRVEGVNLSFMDFAGCDFSGVEFRECDLRGCDFSWTRLRGTCFSACRLDYALFCNIEDISSVRVSKSDTSRVIFFGKDRPDWYSANTEAVLSEMADPCEQWVVPLDPVVAEENNGLPVRLSPFLVEEAPITKKQFKRFLAENGEYAPRVHGRKIENPYYLQYLSRNADSDARPIVNVTLFSCVAYAIANRKRLPTAAEYYAYAQVLGAEPQSENQELGPSDIPAVTEGKTYSTGLVTEWSYQIDDPQYWSSLLARTGRNSGWRRLCYLPPYRRELGQLNCEYFIMGHSRVAKELRTKNSKGGNIVNPDQGFRLVLDYRCAASRLLLGRG